jgi:hypothetical protein
MLYITCPITGKPTPTGMDMPKNTNPKSLNGGRTACKQCPQVHPWNGKDAFFENGEKLSPK